MHIQDRRNYEGRIVVIVGSGLVISEITPAQLAAMNIFDLKWLRDDRASGLGVTIGDHNGNRIRIPAHTYSPYGYGFGFIGKITHKSTLNGKVDADALGPLPLTAPIGTIYDIDGNIVTVAQARAQ